MKNIIIFLLIGLFSCKSDKEKMDDLSYSVLETTINELKTLQSEEENSQYREIKKSIYNIKSDSVIDLYYKIRLDSSELALDYSYDFKDYIEYLRSEVNRKYDSLNHLLEIKEEKKWLKTKAGRIHKKHRNWTREDCERLSDRRIWKYMGGDGKMKRDMIRYLGANSSDVHQAIYFLDKLPSACEKSWAWVKNDGTVRIELECNGQATLDDGTTINGVLGYIDIKNGKITNVR